MRLWDILSADGDVMSNMPEFMDLEDLTATVCTGRIRELIRVNEAMHERGLSQIADQVQRRGAKIIMLAGPSSSGKTTSANRLATHLRVYGKTPVLISLDDYYIDRDKIAPGPDGTIDLEHINTIDTALFSEHTQRLINGETVELPEFDFITTRRKWSGKILQLGTDSVIIVEGLHALNPALLPVGLDCDLIFKLYISPMTTLKLDASNSITPSTLRLLRRTVRDHNTRGASVQRTMSMWDSVRQGEKRWIFPFREGADMTFNSATLYELPVIRKYIYPLLQSVAPDESCYARVSAVMKLLDYIPETDADDEIPPTSIIREFIGGNSFFK